MSAFLTRRQLLQTTAAGLAASWLPPPNVRAADQDRRPVIVDTHLHCFAGAADARFPYHPRGPYQPEPAATPEFLLQCMDGAGVDFAVVVHAEPYQDDHRYLLHCLEVGQGRLKGTCLVFADQPESMAQLPGLAKRGDIRAVRVHAYAPERLPPFGQPQFRNLWKQAADLGLMVQLHLEPRYAPRLEPLISEFRDLTVIVDHLGRPFQGSPQEHAAIVRWSRFKNVIMKLSSLPETRTYPHREIGPTVKQLVEAYGADRLIYGGGFSAAATPESYRGTRERTRSYFAHLGEADQAKILGGTAARLFGCVPNAAAP